MRKEINPPLIAIVVVMAIGTAGFTLWRYAERHKPANVVTAREMLSDPTMTAAVMERYNAKYGMSAGIPR